jgi:tetratricopeptide (TPR) repeat protein
MTWTRHTLTGLILIVILSFLSFHSYSQTDEQYLAGNAFLLKGDYSRAVESLSLAISRNNSDEQLYIRRGQAYLNNNETEKAIDDFNEANLISPNSADLWLARVYATIGNTQESLKYLQSHLKSPFRINEDSIKKDPAFNAIQGTTEWYALWEKDWYTDAEKTIADAEFYARKKQFDQALSLLDNAIIKDPQNAGLMAERAEIFQKQGNYASAAGDFSSAINADKSNPTYFAKRGYALLQSGRHKDAVNDFTKALKEDPADFKLYLKRAEAYAGLMNWQQAVKDVQLYLHYFNDDQDALYQCGEYFYSSGDYINALKYFNSNLKEDPNNALYYKARGKTYLNTATNKYALSDLSMSLDLNPNDAETWMYHGVAAIHAGDKSTGCSSLRRAQQLGSTEAVKYLMENCQ